MVFRTFVLLLVALLLSGCASTQLNYNTLELASTADKLLQQQVLYNVEKFIDSETAIPAQITVTTGTASTTNSIAPSLTSPLDNAVQSVFAAGKGLQTVQATRPSAGVSLSASDTWAQNWGYSPITDAYQMRRLRALYRFAVDGDAEAFVRRFPLLYKNVTINRPQCIYDAEGAVKLKFEPNTSGTSGIDRPVNLCATGYSAGNKEFQVGATTVSDTKLVPDEHYLKGPACIVCLRRGKYGKGRLTKNENLQAGWLRWVNLPGAGNAAARPPAPGDQSLGVYGHHELFVAQGQGDKFVEFTMFVLAASTQTDATGTFNSSLIQSKTGGGKPSTQSIVDSQGNVSTVFPGN